MAVCFGIICGNVGWEREREYTMVCLKSKAGVKKDEPIPVENRDIIHNRERNALTFFALI